MRAATRTRAPFPGLTATILGLMLSAGILSGASGRSVVDGPPLQTAAVAPPGDTGRGITVEDAIGSPPSRDMATTMRVNIEEAIRTLDQRGLVDTLRIGVSGWSRSGWYTDHLLIHSSLPFAAATQIDGGTVEYSDRMRPYTDEELGRIRTPLLLQPHGLLWLIYAGAMADRLRAMGKPVDVLYFHTAPHSTKQPHGRIYVAGGIVNGNQTSSRT